MTGAVIPALAITRGEIKAMMGPADYLRAVEAGFRAIGDGGAQVPPPMSIETADGGFHAKAARLGDRVALKLNGNFPGNRRRYGLPTIQGAILLYDGETGSLLAIMDSIEVTLRRTAAATALAARYLARADASTILVCGCGDQAVAQLEALREVLPLKAGACFDADPARAHAFAAASPGLPLTASDDLKQAALDADVIVTCTTATEPFLTADMVAPGTFVAAVGADNPHKNEIAPELMAKALVVADSLDQCAAMGDLHHAIDAGAMSREDIHAELAEFVAGTKPSGTDGAEITLFDSTGTAIADVAAAAMIYERALAAGAGSRIPLGA